MTSIIELIDLYATIRPLSPGGLYLMRRTATLYAAFIGRPARLSDLTDERVSAWLHSLESSHGAWTRNGHRTRILSLWRFAARRKLADWPGEVRRQPAPEPQPESWTPQEVAQLVAACLLLPCGAEYFRALILTAYESGLRLGDLRRLQREQIRADGVIRLRQHKTDQPHEPRIRPETAAAVLALTGDNPLACPWGPKKYGALWARLRILAGVDRGACQQLRRTGATWIAVDNGMEAARQFLGHKSSGMVRHYVDRSRLAGKQPLPPRVA